jgi:hypothetical protein
MSPFACQRGRALSCHLFARFAQLLLSWLFGRGGNLSTSAKADSGSLRSAASICLGAVSTSFRLWLKVLLSAVWSALVSPLLPSAVSVECTSHER